MSYLPLYVEQTIITKMKAEEEVALRQLQQELDDNFKSIFDRYGRNGIPLGELRVEINERALMEHIPVERMNYLLQRADRDADQHVTYREFSRMMTEDLTKEERKLFPRMMRTAIASLIPRREREDFIANYNCCPPPIFIPLISAVEIAVFIVYVFDLKKNNIETTSTTGVALYSPLVYKPTRRYEAWRFLTYMLMHQGYLHIISNIGFQLLFGTTLEIVHKWWRVGLVYLLGVIAGGLAHSISDHNVSLVGASGGVYAILGAHVAAIVINWKEMNYKCLDPNEMQDNVCFGIGRILLSAPVRLAIILLLVVPDLSVAIYRRVTEPAANKIGVTAHLGGFLAGVMLGIVILKNVNTLTWEKALGWVTLAIYLAFVAFCCLFNALYEGYPPTDWTALA
ncbi:rhomboid-related protein 2-like isoform X2 [Biomphalaria glabrata]|uniref:Rhomboid-related protein 2-like isoform X2 n=1 Tax=Biomphalaria glabrata TaxID=6526 RepID=A0A9W3BGH4_BIOGL|nr:rhomboid-related protein 2-like isoform X2 [Biomphalaria glabrata]